MLNSRVKYTACESPGYRPPGAGAAPGCRAGVAAQAARDLRGAGADGQRRQRRRPHPRRALRRAPVSKRCASFSLATSGLLSALTKAIQFVISQWGGCLSRDTGITQARRHSHSAQWSLGASGTGNDVCCGCHGHITIEKRVPACRMRRRHIETRQGAVSILSANRLLAQVRTWEILFGPVPGSWVRGEWQISCRILGPFE